MLEHYLFQNPLDTTTDVIYPNTANGSFFTTTTYAVTSDSESFLFWGYPTQSSVENLNVGPLKGPHTVVFSPTGLDVKTAAVLTIIYDFGDGTKTVVNRRLVAEEITGATAAADDINRINISHDYYPTQDGITVYNPVITVVNGNLIENTFNISISTVPASIYDLGDIHLINNTQQLATEETQNIFEITNPCALTVARLLSTVNASPTVTAPFSPDTSLPGYEDNLILWLDAADSLTLSRDSYENVLTWYDKSKYQNNFFSTKPNIPNVFQGNSPTFKYPRQSASFRKCVSFKTGKYLYALSDLRTGRETFDLINKTQGYSVFAVMKTNVLGGTLFSYDLNTNEELDSVNGDESRGVNYVPNFNISFKEPAALSVEQGDTSYYYSDGGKYQPTTIDNISQNLNLYSLFSVTISGSDDARAYITADTLIARRRNQNYQYNLSKFLSGGYNSSTILYPPVGENIPTGTYDKKLVYALIGASNAYPDRYLTDTEISEILIFNAPLDPDNVSLVQNYLIKKWGLTLRTD
jgi:hypothetical protein